jgi:signal transduction histidine kinase
VQSRLLRGAQPRVARRAREAEARAAALCAGAPGDLALERRAALSFAADLLVALGAEGELDGSDALVAVDVLDRVLPEGRDAISLLLYRAAVAAPQLRELPPLAAIGLQLGLLLDLGVAADVSLWRRDATGEPECLLALGAPQPARETRRDARAVLRGRSPLRAVRSSPRLTAPLRRFSQVEGVLVATPLVGPPRASAYLTAATEALQPGLERELLLERNQEREQTLVAAGERRLTRLAFDLHDGPVQDVLALASELAMLQRDLDPFVTESHRERAWGRFDDAVARLTELDRSLRDISHSLESSSILSRPLTEVVHRAVDAFSSRSGIAARVEVRGSVDELSDSQRIVVFRAVQEALSNVREHSGADSVEISVHGRRSGTEVSVTDDGRGFDVAATLARSAQLGRLGVVGIGERVRLLGGTFEIDSRPGGPTTLRLSLPRWEPLAPSAGG